MGTDKNIDKELEKNTAAAASSVSTSPVTAAVADDFLESEVFIEDRQFGSLYPIVQWVPGSPAKKREGGIAYTGGFFISAEQSIVVPGAEPYTLVTREGEEIEGFAIRDLVFAPLCWRRSWSVGQDKGFDLRFSNEEYDVALEAGKPRGNVHLLCVVRGMNEPVVITFRGLAAKSAVGMGKDRGALPSFGAMIVTSATRLARAAGKSTLYPLCAFTGVFGPERLQNGDPKFTEVGSKEKSMVSLPDWLDCPKTADKEAITSRFVGHKNLATNQALYNDAEEWRLEWTTERLTKLRSRGKVASETTSESGAASNGAGTVGSQELPI